MTPLHDLGNWLRELLQSIPLPAVRVLFVASLLALLYWVLRLPRSATTPDDSTHRWDGNLKIGAVAAIVIQILIYTCLSWGGATFMPSPWWLTLASGLGC